MNDYKRNQLYKKLCFRIEGLKALTKTLGTKHLAVAEALLSIANSEFELENYSESAARYYESLPIFYSFNNDYLDLICLKILYQIFLCYSSIYDEEAQKDFYHCYIDEIEAYIANIDQGFVISKAEEEVIIRDTVDIEECKSLVLTLYEALLTSMLSILRQKGEKYEAILNKYISNIETFIRYNIDIEQGANTLYLYYSMTKNDEMALKMLSLIILNNKFKTIQTASMTLSTFLGYMHQQVLSKKKNVAQYNKLIDNCTTFNSKNKSESLEAITLFLEEKVKPFILKVIKIYPLNS